MKALFFDLDGTLLDSSKRIPSSAKDALRRCRENGIRVFFASARSPRLDQTLDWTDEEFALFDGGIYCNGASIDYENQISHSFIDPSVVKTALTLADQYPDVHLSLHMPDEGYAFNFAIEQSMYKSWGLAQARILPVDDYACTNSVKLLLFYRHLTDSVKKLPVSLGEQLRSHCGQLANIYVTDEGRTIQIASKNASKLAAIESIRQKLCIGADEIAVFGDDLNDMEMLCAYPNSVAMGNAVPSIQKAARYLTKSNDNNGIAYALEEILHLC